MCHAGCEQALLFCNALVFVSFKRHYAGAGVQWGGVGFCMSGKAMFSQFNVGHKEKSRVKLKLTPPGVWEYFYGEIPLLEYRIQVRYATY